jgi:hypothetical protein
MLRRRLLRNKTPPLGGVILAGTAGQQIKWLGIALFSSPHLLLWWKRPSLRSAGTEGDGFHGAIAVQTTTRAAAQNRGVFIRKMRPFEESRAFAFYKHVLSKHPCGTCSKKIPTSHIYIQKT